MKNDKDFTEMNFDEIYKFSSLTVKLSITSLNLSSAGISSGAKFGSLSIQRKECPTGQIGEVKPAGLEANG